MTAYESALAAIAERRELLAAGTPGPWITHHCHFTGEVGDNPPPQFVLAQDWEVSNLIFGGAYNEPDAQLIVAATNAFAADTDALEAVLLRHAPVFYDDPDRYICDGCYDPDVSYPFPCPDAQAALTALGIDPNGDTP